MKKPWLGVLLGGLLSFASNVVAQNIPFMNRATLAQDVLASTYDPSRLFAPYVHDPRTAPVVAKDMPGHYARLLERSTYVGMLQIASVALLTTMPEQFTHFDKSDLEKRGPLKEWERHVGKPPVIDKDPVIVNASHAFLGGQATMYSAGN